MMTDERTREYSDMIKQYSQEQIMTWRLDRSKYGLGLNEYAKQLGVHPFWLRRSLIQLLNEGRVPRSEIVTVSGQYSLLPHHRTAVEVLLRKKKEQRDIGRRNRAYNMRQKKKEIATKKKSWLPFGNGVLK